jgi:hypothetical protein
MCGRGVPCSRFAVRSDRKNFDAFSRRRPQGGGYSFSSFNAAEFMQ